MGWVTVGCCGVVLAATFQRHFKVVVSCKALWPTDAPVVQPGSTADVLDLVSPLHGLLEAEEVFFADVVARVPKCAVERDVRAEHQEDANGLLLRVTMRSCSGSRQVGP
jgi:hypothetical protein